MYESLKRVSGDFHLYIFAFDEISFDILKKLSLEKATIISLDEFETPELLEAKQTRTVAEYCWTCTPATIWYVLENYKVPECTYLDSDLYFYSDPSVLISELYRYKKNVLITEHRFAAIPRFFHEKRAGRFCVQFVTFLNEDSSLKVLEKWKSQCIEWCYSRYEDGKFGDQKYLDSWPDNYPEVHILEHPGGGIAPWNLTDYLFNIETGSVTGRKKDGSDEFMVIFFHFQYVKFMMNNLCDIGWYYITPSARKVFYNDYLKNIVETELQLSSLNAGFRRGITKQKVESLKGIIKLFLKRVLRYNILNLKQYGPSY